MVNISIVASIIYVSFCVHVGIITLVNGFLHSHSSFLFSSKLCLRVLRRAARSWLDLLEKTFCHYFCSFINILILLLMFQVFFFNQLLLSLLLMTLYPFLVRSLLRNTFFFCFILKVILHLSFLSLFQKLQRDFLELSLASHLATFNFPRIFSLYLDPSFPLPLNLCPCPSISYLLPPTTPIPTSFIHIVSLSFLFLPLPTQYTHFPRLTVPCYLSSDSRPVR